MLPLPFQSINRGQMGVKTMASNGLRSPLNAALACSALFRELEQLGFTASVHSDMQRMHEVKQAARGAIVAPMHDPNVCDFSGNRAYWMSLAAADKATVGLQAFRCDMIDTSLADWCAPYMIGIYMRRNELMIPSHAKPPRDSVSERLRGKVVYHGEIWIDKQVRNRRVFEAFTRLGLLIALIKWNPDSVWGLASAQMAGHGHVGRIGYTTIERGFLRWEWASEGIDPVEYLCVIDRNGLEQMVDEMMTTKAESLPAIRDPQHSL
jgi:hypothetical protein